MLRKRNVLAAGAIGALMISTAVAQPAAAAAPRPSLIPARPLQGAISNAASSGVGVGVIHFADGNCTYGTHDTVLPAGEDTFHYQPIRWSEVAGVWVGRGYEATITGGPGNRSYYIGPESWNVDPWGQGGNWTITVRKL